MKMKEKRMRLIIDIMKFSHSEHNHRKSFYAELLAYSDFNLRQYEHFTHFYSVHF